MAKRRGNGEGSIYRDKDGRWRGSVHVGYGGGKRRRKLVSGRTRAEVARRLQVALRAAEMGIPPVPERQTLEQFLERWLTDSVKPTVRYSTHDSYSRLVKKHINPGLGRIALAKLRPQHVQAFLNERLEAGLSPRTVQYLRAILRRALGQALKWGLVARNVATLVDPPKVQRPEVQPLSPEHARTFLAAVQGHRLEALYTVAIAIGLRLGEGLGLRWIDAEIDSKTISIRNALQRVEGRLILVPPKAARSRRTIRLPEVTVEALRAHKIRQQQERLLAGTRWQENGLIFASTIGTPLDARNVTRHFQQTLALLGLPRKRFHDLRHTCASFLLAQGVSPRTVMEVLGHSQVSLTLDTYAHVAPSLLDDAAGKMDAILKPVASTLASTAVVEKVN